jgi:CubicO group peptidase (beta-lactamase class C family)
MKRIVLAVLAVFFACDLGIAADSGSQETTRLAKKVDAVFAKWDTTMSPGCAVAIIRDGKVIYKRGYGMANLDHDVPIRTDSVFHVASMSKQFTAAAIILLEQERRLSFDDPIHKYLPQLPDFGHTITIRHLVHHTSGLRDQWGLLDLSGWRYSRDLITDSDIMSLIYMQKELNFPPGEKMQYSNTNYTLLGQVVEKVAGKSLREFTTSRLFKPLGMSDTHFRDDFQEVVKKQATGYTRDTEKDEFRVSVTNFNTVGATSLLTTVEDLALWDQNFYEPKVGGNAFLENMHQLGSLKSGEILNRAFGIKILEYRGLKAVESGGHDAGYRSVMLRFPDYRFTVICLCNLAEISAGSLSELIANIYLEQEFTTDNGNPPRPSAFTISDKELSRFEGLYRCDNQPSVIRTTAVQGKLVAQLGEWQMEWRPVEANLFVHNALKARFEAKESDWPSTLVIEWKGEEGSSVYQRQEPYQPEVQQLKDFVGVYRSNEIDPVYRITLTGKEIILHRQKSAPDPLEPLFEDAFRGSVASGSVLRFERDKKNNVVGFKWNGGGVQNFRFLKTEP